MDHESQHKKYIDLTNEYIDEVFSSLKGNETLISSMRYSMTIGGKRIRPCLLLAFCEEQICHWHNATVASG